MKKSEKIAQAQAILKALGLPESQQNQISALTLVAQVLRTLGFPITEYDKLPDVIIYDEKRNWLFLVEAVTSHGPMSGKRVLELELMLAESRAGLIYVSAFPDMTEFRRHTTKIAWDTEVWIADLPEHMIHYNGDRFLGPGERSHT